LSKVEFKPKRVGKLINCLFSTLIHPTSWCCLLKGTLKVEKDEGDPCEDDDYKWRLGACWHVHSWIILQWWHMFVQKINDVLLGNNDLEQTKYFFSPLLLTLFFEPFL
jgi:hypothetical protein